MLMANTLSHARQKLSSNPDLSTAWKQFLAHTKKRTSAPVPTVWLEFVKWYGDQGNDTTDLLPNSERESNEPDQSQDEQGDTPDNSGESDTDSDETEPEDSDNEDSQDEDSDNEDSQDEDSDNDDSQDEDSDNEDSQDGETYDNPLEREVRRIAHAVAVQVVRQHEAELHTGAPTQTSTMHSKPLPKLKVADSHKPYWFDHVQELLHCGIPTLLSGPKGCGKTHVAQMLADSLGLDLYPMSFSGGVDECHIIGAPMPDENGKFVHMATLFVTACEQGGLILADEFDGADPNVLLIWNMAIANRILSIPFRKDNPVVRVHPDTRFLAAANTLGQGADRHYVARNQLDAATLSRFEDGLVVIDYDEQLEKRIYSVDNVKFAHRLRARCRAIRAFERDVSTRNIANQETKISQGVPLARAWYPYFQSWSKEELRSCDVKLDDVNLTAELL